VFQFIVLFSCFLCFSGTLLLRYLYLASFKKNKSVNLSNAGLNGASKSNMLIQLFYNPHSGMYSEIAIKNVTEAFERLGAVVICTESLLNKKVEIEQGVSHICIAGGDGTARTVIQAIMPVRKNISFSIYPIGTVNLIARENGYASDPNTFAKYVLTKEAARIHFTVKLNDTLFLACASVGPDSVAVASVSLRMKQSIGRAAYLVALLKTFFKWDRPHITLEASGQSYDCEAFYVAKGRHFAGKWSFAHASLNQPLLHVVALKYARRRDFIRFIWAIARDRVKEQEGLTFFTCTEMKAFCPDALPVQADGDIVTTLPVTLSINTEPLRFL